MNEPMKICRNCAEDLPLSLYYKHAQMLDGHLNVCKECVKARVRQHRRLNEHVREYDRRRYRENQERRRNIAARTRQFRVQNPVAYKAHTAVSNAVRDGRLNKEPCLFCGATKNVHAHHKDYSRPLDVQWLCARCHNRLHANFHEAAE